ncbi:arginine deiminase family protein [Myxococcota bacterium]|nr:arginine deiminase family protein [Myxococcota bacterium]
MTTPTCCPPPTPSAPFVAGETDRLRACVVHTPGRELERLTPANYRWHLFDDLLDPGRARGEHERLQALLVAFGIAVYRFGDLLAEVYGRLSRPDREALLDRVYAVNPGAPAYVFGRLARADSPRRVARALIEGVEATGSFSAEVEDALFHLAPMGNVIFMQDAAVVVRDRIVQGYMSRLVRLQEEVVLEEVLQRHEAFGPSGSAKFWLDPDFRARHRMDRRVHDYLRVEAERLALRLGHAELGRGGEAMEGWPAQAERVVLELENAHVAAGRHFTLEGGNLLPVSGPDGKGGYATVVLIGHNARSTADAIDELSYRLLRPEGGDEGPRPSGVGAVVVVDFQDPSEDAGHLDTRVLLVDPRTLLVDRTLVEPPDGPGARFYVFDLPPERTADPPEGPDDGGEVEVLPKLRLRACPGLGEALTAAWRAAGIASPPPEVRWVPGWDLWTGPPPGSSDVPPGTHPTERWIALQQLVWANALNALVIAPGVLVGFERHRRFYEDATAGPGAVCVGAAEILDAGGRFHGLTCCALLGALRRAAPGRNVALLLPGDELSRARGGPGSLVMPLVRTPEGGYP